MGVNIGIFVINILVFMGEIIYCNDFWWVFVGVMVYDMFNWLVVIVFLFLEVLMGKLYFFMILFSNFFNY